MSSVRSRIEAFEALGKDDSEADNNRNNTGTKKRFQYPGAKQRSNTEPPQPSNFTINKPAKSQGLADFESDLQEVWSVRKNIHHRGSKVSTTHQSSTATSAVSNVPGHYSRHGAIAAQQSHGAPVLPKSNKDPIAKPHTTVSPQNDDEFSFETKRMPLQEQHSPWNVKKNTYSYNSSEVPNKRPSGSPNLVNGVASPPVAKRKLNVGEADVVRPTKVNDLMFPTRRKTDEKVGYARKMANSYLRSVGIGEYTPAKPDNKPSDKHVTSRWKHGKEDDFNF